MLEIKNQLFEVRRIVKKCSKCKKIKHTDEFATHLYDNAPNKEILVITRTDDLYPRCRACQNKIKKLKSAQITAKKLEN